MGCFKTLALNLAAGGEMPLNDAVYVSSVDKIFGTMGPYVVKCNATTGARESSVRVAGPVYGPCRLCYHAATGKLYVSCWYDPAWVDGTGLTYSDRSDIYPVDPATMTVGVKLGIKTLFGAMYSNRYGMDGPQAIVSSGNYLYFLFRYQGGGGAVARVNPANTADNAFNGAWTWWAQWNISQFSVRGSYIYLPEPYKDIYRGAITMVGGLANPLPVFQDDETPIAVESVADGEVWAVCGNGNLLYGNFNTAAYSAYNLEAIQLNCKPFRLRYNSANGLIYIPCQNSDAVIVWSPSTSNGTLKSGFDGPIDCVFTPTRKFAVQSGPVGLKEIT